MRVQVNGILRDERVPPEPREVTWDEGTLSGDFFARNRLLLQAMELELQHVTLPPLPGGIDAPYFQIPEGFLQIAAMVFRDGYTVDGYEPEPERESPEDAVF